jgi:hypothetical protein
MARNACETSYESNQPVIVSVRRLGASARLYVENQSPHAVKVRRLRLRYETDDGSGVLYVRPHTEAAGRTLPPDLLGSGITALYSQLDASSAKLVHAQADFVELSHRACRHSPADRPPRRSGTLRYWLLRLDGERSAEEVDAQLGPAAGSLLRLHVERGETRVYYATEPAAQADPSKAVKAAEKPVEIRADEVTRLS